MGYLQTHRGLVSDRTIIAPGSALRGRVYELKYDSETATKTKYIVLGINIYPKGGGKSKQLLHCLDLDEIPVAEVRKLIRSASEIITGYKSGLKHQQLIIEGRSTAIYDGQLKKLQKRTPYIGAVCIAVGGYLLHTQPDDPLCISNGCETSDDYKEYADKKQLQWRAGIIFISLGGILVALGI